MKWTENLPSDVYNRLRNCRSTKADIQTLVNVKWAAMKANGKQEQGFTKEDALIDIMELLDCNSQYFDLTREEYDELKHE